MDGKLRIAAQSDLIVCHTFITRECTEDFTDSTKKGNGRLRNKAMEVARSMKKTTVDSKSLGKNTGYTRDLHG